jgi:hypothetical protein
MAKRANLLAERIEQGSQALAALVEGLTDDQWQTIIPDEERTVGVLVHHVATVYPLEIELARNVAAGRPVVGVNWDGIAHMNAQHAHDNLAVGKQETLELLQQNSKMAADRVREFSDEELDTAATVSLNAEAPLTAQFLIEDHALRHSFHHMAAIRAVLKR